MNSFPADMSTWTPAFGWLGGTDATTTATPLGVLKEGGDFTFSHLDLFLGNTGGCLGETCALALILGGVYLMVRRVISPVIPVTYLATVAVISLIAGRDPPGGFALRRPAHRRVLHGHRLHHQPHQPQRAYCLRFGLPASLPCLSGCLRPCPRAFPIPLCS